MKNCRLFFKPVLLYPPFLPLTHFTIQSLFLDIFYPFVYNTKCWIKHRHRLQK
ncbi:hypothetical protein B4099_2288 [Heyndrickxia coagulans]|uniref:Uncharacterized protein n=1 Tax=Heyndrickxia coagulans TaxID=1398 RepID=A0A150K9X5_HEYCO|nr:hypothetical protein B4099_2288 [Heyndrickxia coagulans]